MEREREREWRRGSIDAGNSRGRAQAAQARLTDGTTRRDGPMSFHRVEEIQAVVDVYSTPWWQVLYDALSNRVVRRATPPGPG